MNITGQYDGAIPAAVGWIEAALTGSVATSIAIIAVATLGMSMLWGRLQLRNAARAALGVFILFGAPVLAYELTVNLRAREVSAPDIAQSASRVQNSPQMPNNAPVNDPYAGAAVPQLQ